MILFTFLLNVCVVQAAYHKFVNDPAQRKLCRAKNKFTCGQDEKCGWNDVQWMCNEAGYQPDVQHCSEQVCPGQCIFCDT